ncbi:MAG: carboxypeptidase-like regulatory domain-containing protein [Putridiphycobacter sp.]|nr:carboxypeptidase-like regulatory domain-containing protein [Putridiphycobacter sp.]
MINKIFLSFFAVLLTIFSFGQGVELTGKIIDGNGRAVGSALIKVIETGDFTTSNDRGFFTVSLKSGQTYNLQISAINYESERKTIKVNEATTYLGEIVIFQKDSKVIIVESRAIGGTIEKIKPPDIGVVPSSTGNFEDYIKLTGLGVSSNNELTSNYNVRGGNFDENLIYVNGIEIYRPLLARSGQQEGLSFINSAFVENIYFSAGGFDANYGDKLASVLDVQYKEATGFKGSAQLSLMGAEFHIENTFGTAKRGNFITGARYRTNAYLLSALPTKGDYFPNFFDYQLSLNYYTVYDNADSYQKLFVLGHFANNNYKFIPKTKTTRWGTVNEAYQLRIFYEGQEKSNFQTVTGAVGYKWKVNKQFDLTLSNSIFYSNENENYDILGEYWINSLETDPSKEEFGDSTENVGVGGFLNHARNNLVVYISNTSLNGNYQFKNNTRREVLSKSTNANIKWGINYRFERYDDLLSEWKIIDSSGYITPLDDEALTIDDLIKTNNLVTNANYTSYGQYTYSRVNRKDLPLTLQKTVKTDSGKYTIVKVDTIQNAPSSWNFTVGARLGYRAYNKEPWFTPRANISYSPRSYLMDTTGLVSRRNIKFRLSTGLYFQPPAFREMRDLFGQIVPAVLAQKSWHNVLGLDVYVQMWGRPFKIVAETYYKYLWDINPYEIDNVKIRYYAKNNSKAFAYGFDAKINGEFIKGVESHFRIGLLQTKEDLLDDFYVEYYNDTGAVVFQGSSDVSDSATIFPGYIPRQTEQLITFSVFFQDKIPNYENFKVAVNMQFGSPLPYGPPTFNRYQDVLRSKAYFRTDLGIIYDFITAENKAKFSEQKILSTFSRMSISLNATNLLDFQNVISFNWLQDIYGRYYSIPNYLSGFRLNLKLVAEF